VLRLNPEKCEIMYSGQDEMRREYALQNFLQTQVEEMDLGLLVKKDLKPFSQSRLVQ
jgi:hypothetical protein